MAMTPALKTQVAAIQSRLNTVAETATPEDLVMLAKAVEAIGGQATIFDVIEAGEGQQTALADTAATQKADILNAAAEKIKNINEVADIRYAQFEQTLEAIGGFVAPTAEAPGKAGLVPSPAAGTERHELTSNGWQAPLLPVGTTISMPEDWADDHWVKLTSSPQTALIADYPLLAALQGQKRNRLHSFAGKTAVRSSLNSESPLFFNRETREFVTVSSSPSGLLVSTDGMETLVLETTETPASGEDNFAIAHGVLVFRKAFDSTYDDFYIRADGVTSPLAEDSKFAKSSAHTYITAAGDFIYAACSMSTAAHVLWRVNVKTKAVSKIEIPSPFQAPYIGIVTGTEGVCVVCKTGVATVRHDASVAKVLAGTYSKASSNNGSGWDTVQSDNVQFLNGMFILVKDDGTALATSTDLLTWKTISLAGYGPFSSLFYHDQSYYLTFEKVILSGKTLDALSPYAAPAIVKAGSSSFYGMFLLRGTFIASTNTGCCYKKTEETTWNSLKYSTDTEQASQIRVAKGSMYICEEQGIALLEGYVLDADTPYANNNNFNAGKSQSPGANPTHVFFGIGCLYFIQATTLYRCVYYSYNPDTEFLLPTTATSGYRINTRYNDTKTCPIFMRAR